MYVFFLQVNIFTGFCVTVSVLALLLILIFLTRVKTPKSKQKYTVWEKVSGVFRLMFTSRDLQLLVPDTIVGGITMAFITGDYNVVRSR